MKAQAELSDDGRIIYDVFLIDSQGQEKEIGEKVYQYYIDKSKECLVWLDSERFLVNGEKIITTDGIITELRPLWGELTYASSFSLNADRSKLALIGKDGDCNRLVKIIDLDELKVIAEKKHPYIESGRTGELLNKLAWDEKDRIYYENDLEAALTHDSYNIYCLDSSGSRLLQKNHVLLGSSPDFRYIAMLKCLDIDKEASCIYDTRNEAFLNGNVKGQIVWMGSEQFAGIERDGSAEANLQVYLYRIEAGQIIEGQELKIPAGSVDSIVMEEGKIKFKLMHTRNDGLMEAFEVLRSIDSLLQEIGDKSSLKNTTISIKYIDYPSKKRFVANETELLALPQKGSSVLRIIEANTLVDVKNAAISGKETEIWLNVEIPVYDSPINTQGWTRESTTLPYTEDKQKVLQSEVKIKEGTKIYEVYEFEAIANTSARRLDMDSRGRIEEKKEGYARITAPGGWGFWVKEEYLIYPRVEADNSGGL